MEHARLPTAVLWHVAQAFGRSFSIDTNPVLLIHIDYNTTDVKVRTAMDYISTHFIKSIPLTKNVWNGSFRLAMGNILVAWGRITFPIYDRAPLHYIPNTSLPILEKIMS
jgi:hypothetical protein